MERVSITERPDWREKATEYGFNFHTMYGEPYWSEEAYYKLTLAQVEKLEAVTAELHQMCLQVVEKVIASDELMTKFRIPKHTWGFVRQSWKTNQPSLYSRLDLAWDGVGEPKLLENNADTPTSLYEAAFFQWIWLEDQLNAGKLPAGSDQFNSLQEKLIDRFGELREQFGFQLLHMACCRDTVEDRGTVQYLQDCAAEAGLATEFLYVEDIGLGRKRPVYRSAGSGDWQSVQALSVGVYAAGDVLHQAGRRWRPLAGAGVEKHYLQQGAAADAVGDVPQSP